MKKLVKAITHPIFVIFIIFYSLFFFAIGKKIYENIGVKATHSRDWKMITETEKKLKVRVTPPFPYSYNLMRKGVLQHIDRDYTYDVIPDELIGGILFQGIHRPPKGTELKIELLSPAIIYFFFHRNVDGGYNKIFNSLEGWEKCKEAPKYDIYNGTHGHDMVMYKMIADQGLYTIPPTTKDKACFSIVFK